MTKSRTGLLTAVALVVLATVPAGAQTATFDEFAVTGRSSTGVTAGYTFAGSNWNNIGVVNGSTFGFNTAGCIVSSSNCMYNGSGTGSSITSATPFDFNSGYFMAWYNGGFGNPVTLTVEGYFGAELRGTQTLDLSTTTAQNYAFNYSGVDNVVFTTNGGSGDAYYLGDNLVFNASATPEPASLVLLATGLLGIGGIARRRKTMAA